MNERVFSAEQKKNIAEIKTSLKLSRLNPRVININSVVIVNI